MTVTIELPPDIEAGLLAQAQAEGVAVSDYLQNLVREQIVTKLGTSAPARTPCELSTEEWVEQFEMWADSFPAAPPIPDEALSRENLYPDRWQMAILVDTNILVRAVERNHPMMRPARLSVRALVQKGEELCVTPQNIAEFWSVCTRPANLSGLGNSIAATDRLAQRIEMFFTVLPDSMQAFRIWRHLVVAHEVKGSKVHDARLAAIMRAHGIKEILTFNTADFKRFSDVVALHPTEVIS